MINTTRRAKLASKTTSVPNIAQQCHCYIDNKGFFILFLLILFIYLFAFITAVILLLNTTIVCICMLCIPFIISLLFSMQLCNQKYTIGCMFTSMYNIECIVKSTWCANCNIVHILDLCLYLLNINIIDIYSLLIVYISNSSRQNTQ